MFCGCGKKEKINNYIIDAEYAFSHGDYDAAKEAYNNILSLDKENRTAIYGLKDLEEAARLKDEYLCADLHTALCEGVLTHELDGKSSYITPQPGDYSLVEFVNNSGNAYWDYVYNRRMNVSNGYSIQSMLVSWDKDGNKLMSKEIRVALYSLNNKGMELCVYVPDSYNPNTGDIISAGVKYNPSFDFSKVSVDSTFVGVHSYTFLVDVNGNPVESFKQGEIIYCGEITTKNSNAFVTKVNPATQYEVESYTVTGLLNWPDIGGCVLKDEYGNYYITCGKFYSKYQELQCISEYDAMRSLDFMDIPIDYNRLNKN
jgi:hypothetical protein